MFHQIKIPDYQSDYILKSQKFIHHRQKIYGTSIISPRRSRERYGCFRFAAIRPPVIPQDHILHHSRDARPCAASWPQDNKTGYCPGPYP